MYTHRSILLLFFLLAGIACRQNYLPPVLRENPGFLVVEGIINCNTGDSTTFQLSRTQAVGDSVGAYTPELNAQVSILGGAGDIWPLHESGGGAYSTAAISLNPAEKYRVKIVTRGGTQYLSDTVSVHPSPPIDSLTWIQDDSAGDVHIKANTHDPTNNSHYYRWFYSEFWEYHTPLYASLQLINGLIAYTDTTTSTYICWRGDNSKLIVLANTTALSQDRVNQAEIGMVPRGSQKISERYSMLATQYVLSQTAYQYWQILEKNTQNLGSLFDPQPSQLSSNYHNLSNPQEPVIGYLSASTLQRQRLFISNQQVHNWDTAHEDCGTKEAYKDPNDFRIYHGDDPDYGPYYFTMVSLVLKKRICLDCRLQGGTTKRPDFW